MPSPEPMDPQDDYFAARTCFAMAELERGAKEPTIEPRDGWRCAGTNLFSRLVRWDPQDFGKKLVGRGPELCARTVTLIEQTFKSTDFRRYCAARGINIDAHTAFQNATARVIELSKAQLSPGWFGTFSRSRDLARAGR